MMARNDSLIKDQLDECFSTLAAQWNQSLISSISLKTFQVLLGEQEVKTLSEHTPLEYPQLMVDNSLQWMHSISWNWGDNLFT